MTAGAGRDDAGRGRAGDPSRAQRERDAEHDRLTGEVVEELARLDAAMQWRRDAADEATPGGAR